MKYTPGPWERYGDDTDILVGNMISDSHGACDGIRQVCVVKQGDFEIPDYGEAQANARLIAAAPDLLEALEGLLKHIWDGRPARNVRRDFDLMVYEAAARAAIAKAEGRA